MALSLSGLVGAQTRGSVLDMIAHPAVVDPLSAQIRATEAAGNTLRVQQAMSERAVGQALQQATDPSTGVVDYNKFAVLAARDPQAAFAMRAGLGAASQLKGEQLDNASKFFTQVGAATSSLVRDPSDENVDSSFASLNGLYPQAELDAERNRVKAMSPDERRTYAYQHGVASLDALSRLHQGLGTTDVKDIGGGLVTTTTVPPMPGQPAGTTVSGPGIPRTLAPQLVEGGQFVDANNQPITKQPNGTWATADGKPSSGPAGWVKSPTIVSGGTGGGGAPPPLPSSDTKLPGGYTPRATTAPPTAPPAPGTAASPPATQPAPAPPQGPQAPLPPDQAQDLATKSGRSVPILGGGGTYANPDGTKGRANAPIASAQPPAPAPAPQPAAAPAPQPGGPSATTLPVITAPSPGTTERLAADSEAYQKDSAAVPVQMGQAQNVQEALKLLKFATTGNTTENWNGLKNTLVTWGAIDPNSTANYEQLRKIFLRSDQLNRMLSGGTDAAQALAKLANPDVALTTLANRNILLNDQGKLLQGIAINMDEDRNAVNRGGYIDRRSDKAINTDPRGFIWNSGLYTPEEKQQIANSVGLDPRTLEPLPGKTVTEAGKRLIKSIAMAHRLGLETISGQVGGPPAAPEPPAARTQSGALVQPSSPQFALNALTPPNALMPPSAFMA
jgi:hypothetical protein